MNTNCKAVAAVLLCAFCASARADELRGLQPDSLLGGLVRESDVALLFDYLREVISGGAEGRNVTPPGELARRAEAIGEEAKRRGAAAARALIDEVESVVREGMRGQPRRSTLPPSSGRIPL